MLKDYLDQLQQRRESHQISKADFESWKSNIITLQLFEDLEILAIEKAEEVCARDANTAGLQAAKLNGIQDTMNYAVDWMPDYLEGYKYA